jgi:Fe-Mn family superoxide dismutase
MVGPEKAQNDIITILTIIKQNRMTKFEEKKFSLPKLKGLSEKNIEEHLKLYAGYVKNSNSVIEKISELSQDQEKNSYIIGELFRRFSFEYNGMRNHEVYFGSLENGPAAITPGGDFEKVMVETCGSVEIFMTGFKNMAMTRGVGWAMLWLDIKNKRLLTSWVDEHHLGQLSGCAPILALDMWEHSFVADYTPSGKKNYIEDFFANLNWHVIEQNFSSAL